MRFHVIDASRIFKKGSLGFLSSNKQKCAEMFGEKEKLIGWSTEYEGHQYYNCVLREFGRLIHFTNVNFLKKSITFNNR